MDDENLLIKKAKAGDLDAYEQIIKTYEKKVFNLVYRIMKSQEEIEDIAQEVFIKIYKNLKNFKEESSLYTWIYKITVNVCIDVRKKKRKVISIDEKIDLGDSETTIQIEDKEKPLEEQVEVLDMRRRLNQCINQLPESHRIIIILRDIKGLSYQEIAEILDINIGTVKSKINRARVALKELVIKDGTFI